MPEHTRHQKRIIDRYYEHRDDIMLAKLGELVSELYLAETDKKRGRLWDRAAAAMRNLKWKPATIEHILAQRRPELLASHLAESMKRRGA